MIILLLGLFGLVLGSFVNAFVWRLHEQEELVGKHTQAARRRRRELSIAKGRSMCPNCSHELAAKDLVPVLSWLWLHGKCRYCQKPISAQYPIVELVTAGLFIVSYLSWPLTLHRAGMFQLVVWLSFLVAFMALALYDLRWLMLPDKIVFPLVALAVIQVVIVHLWAHTLGTIWQPAVAALIIFGLFWTLFQVSGGRWIGGGDVKLALVLGLLAATPLKAFLVIFFSSLLGTLISIPLLAKGKKGLKLQIPFGPYLLAATLIVVLYGDRIVHWYENLLMV